MTTANVTKAQALGDELEKRVAVAIHRVDIRFTIQDKEAEEICLELGFLERDNGGFRVTELGSEFYFGWNYRQVRKARQQ
jgi:hypothetical protein